MIPVTLIMASSLDGKIAKNKDHFANWTSKEDKQVFIQTSKDFGMIMMGYNTFKTFPSPLKNRLNVVFTENKELEIEGVKWVSGEPEKVLEELKTLGFKKALLGGGTSLNTLFLQKKLINEIILTVEPKIFGSGLSLFKDDFDLSLELLELKQINQNSYLVRYKVIY
ncbi:dihydrofolate reductase [Candidatus Falkowbacteria bacterium HGW-Falkowbacteria-1]|uniref:Dihydrofolate reductase n=1 Tax=Candidatus Falkowbacteria bacterium HGW-Falkowbacteria-1 TaxID=2013768 RepID=A0A2N2EAB5_9BACT|nr:MAG: dihydrofolate reductase [Candidatus Falkowbacteria bacterium HGW-Falkowbacteria-1]